MAPVSATQANADVGAQRTPLQPAAAARTPPSAAVDSPDEPRASPAPAPAPRQRGPAPQLSRQQQKHQRKQFGAHYAALEQAKAEARETAAEMLDTIRQTPTPKAGKARFGGNDLRWQLIKELLRISNTVRASASTPGVTTASETPIACRISNCSYSTMIFMSTSIKHDGLDSFSLSS